MFDSELWSSAIYTLEVEFVSRSFSQDVDTDSVFIDNEPMLNIPQLLVEELSLKLAQVENVLGLLQDGGTIPFIARYRKERTGGLDEVKLRKLAERQQYLTGLQERKTVILDSIAKQGKLTDELQAKIEACMQKTGLEDIYLPYKPKKRARATRAKEKGLGPLARWIQSQNTPRITAVDLEAAAQKYVVPEKNVKDVAEALRGAADILAEAVSEKAELRAFIRNFILRHGSFVSKIKSEFAPGTTNFEIYRDYKVKIHAVSAHGVLALRRGEAADVLTLNVVFDETAIATFLEGREIHTRAPAIYDFYQRMLKDALQRLLKPSLINEIQQKKKQEADQASIQTFAANLRQLLLASPAGMKPTLGIDPGFRTGCKVAAVDGTGKFLQHQTIFPFADETSKTQAKQTVIELIQRHNIELIAVGNGTAGRQTDAFIGEVIGALALPPIKVMVNEAGASVYSASAGAAAEFAELDLTVRGAISIARRLQDPLAELVKIDPKSIGVGQYQHDVDPKQLKGQLEETVESCVNFVGVDLNTASKELLSYVAGIVPSVAENLVRYRDAHGPFKDRQTLLDVPRFGAKTFEQASGFLRIRAGGNFLDNTGVHPESYHVVRTIAQDLEVSLQQITQMADELVALDLQKYVTDTIGAPTLQDIVQELQKPGRDPRAKFKYATFHDEITTIEDLLQGMVLEGVVTNVTNFGAFVDIGVHQDGLVHISQMADHFVADPTQVVKVGTVVHVRVLEINVPMKRIGLSLRLERERA